MIGSMNAPSYRIFVLGGFADIGGPASTSKRLLENLVEGLVRGGWDAFLSGDARSLKLAGSRLTPRQMTETLEALADLAVYVGWSQGRGDGWASELTAMQLKHPERASHRLIALEEGYPLSTILDPDAGGYLADPPVRIEWWWGEEHLLTVVERIADLQASRRGF
jgi:hypothetical protein